MLSEQKRDELLIRLDERMKKNRNDVKDLKAAMESDEGFNRCQLHSQKMAGIENSVKRTKRSAWTAVIALVGKIAWEYIAPVFPG
jgi:hypothetical protein